MNKKALIMVDLQNDFCHGGSLAVPDGDAVIAIANMLQPQFDLVVATKDWHPKNHMSFALWPEHCVQNTKGAEFHPELDSSHIQHIIQKGADRFVDSYSAFFDNEQVSTTGLADYLQREGVSDIYIMGLATDYCVKYSCLDAVKLNYNTHVILDACRGVELNSGDIDEAIKEMQDAGVKLTDRFMRELCG